MGPGRTRVAWRWLRSQPPLLQVGVWVAVGLGVLTVLPEGRPAPEESSLTATAVDRSPDAAPVATPTSPAPEPSGTRRPGVVRPAPSPVPADTAPTAPDGPAPAAPDGPAPASPAPPRPAATGLTTTVVRIVDGDTLYLADLAERLRLIGIDTPETTHPTVGVECFGREASAHLSELVPPGTRVRVEWDVERMDRFDRPLGYLYRVADDAFVNLRMIADGHAAVLTVPPNLAHQDELLAAQRDARDADLGLWSSCGGPDAPASPVPTTAATVGAVPPGPAPGDAGPGTVSIVSIRWDGPGRDVDHGDSEYVELGNAAGDAVDVSGWSVTDAGAHTITLPAGTSIAPGGRLRIHTGPGEDTETAHFGGRPQAIWNNDGGDTATLRDASGAVVDEYSYAS